MAPSKLRSLASIQFNAILHLHNSFFLECLDASAVAKPVISSGAVYLPTLSPVAHVAHPWYGRKRRRSLISNSEDIQTFSTDTSDQLQGRRHKFKLLEACRGLAVALWLFLPCGPAKPLVPLYRLYARTPRENDRLAPGEASGRSTDATFVLALGPKKRD